MQLFRRHPIFALLALFGFLFSAFIVSSTEASAAPVAVTGGPTLDVRVGSPHVCINDHTQGSGIPYYTAAQRWNANAAIYVLHESDVGGDCTAAGYPLGRQLEVHLVDSNEDGCVHYFSTGVRGSDGRMYRTRTIAYVHKNNLWCWSTATRKANEASQQIGGFLGAAMFDNTTVSVMGTRTYNDVAYPIPYDLDTINDHYPWWRKV